MSVPKASTVASKFVKEYYTKLQNSPETMKLFYNDKVSAGCVPLICRIYLRQRRSAADTRFPGAAEKTSGRSAECRARERCCRPPCSAAPRCLS